MAALPMSVNSPFLAWGAGDPIDVRLVDPSTTLQSLLLPLRRPHFFPRTFSPVLVDLLYPCVPCSLSYCLSVDLSPCCLSLPVLSHSCSAFAYLTVDRPYFMITF